MTAPETAWARLGGAFLWGLALGLWYDFLRPLRPRCTALADGAFLLGAAFGWLHVGFGICGGDLRLGYMAGLAAGALGWILGPGRLTRRVFSLFWGFWGAIGGKLLLPVKKISKITKILFASAEKWVTIKWNNRRLSRRASGGKPYGRNKKSLQRHPGGLPPQQTPDQSGGDRGYRVVYGSADHSALGTK